MTIFRSEPGVTRPARGLGKWRGAAIIAVLLAVAAGALVLRARAFSTGPTPVSLTQARMLPIILPNGKPAILGDVIKPGIPTVIGMWASWCGPCRREAPKIAELRSRFGRDQLNLVYLNVREDGASPDDLMAYLDSVGLDPKSYAVMSRDVLGRLTNDTVNSIPRTYVFDRLGNPTAMIVGYKPLALDRVAGLVGQ